MIHYVLNILAHILTGHVNAILSLKYVLMNVNVLHSPSSMPGRATTTPMQYGPTRTLHGSHGANNMHLTQYPSSMQVTICGTGSDMTGVIERQFEIPMNLDSRNVRDKFKQQSIVEIKEQLPTSDLHIVFMNVAGDFNKSTGVRNAAFFNAASVTMVGKRRWDKRGAVGAWNYIPVNHMSLADFPAWFNFMQNHQFYYMIAIENNRPDTVSIHDFPFPRKSVVLFGEEGAGLPDNIIDMCNVTVEIPGKGVMRSLNVGTASGIVMYEYMVQNG